MPTFLGSVRSLVMTPSLSEVTFAKRGFQVQASAATEQLEHIPQTVICGFEWGIDATSLWELERRLQVVEPELRGFAYEGATMAYTIRDAMGGGHRTRDLLRGPGLPHIFLTYIGIGFAMARLPRPVWKKVMPDLDGTPYYPTMTWLAVDGYGFDRAYFHTRKWVDQQFVPKPYPWAGSPEYFLRAVDHGIGRALWFINGAQPAAAAAAVRRFAEHRQADLWSGVGLAAVFAGAGDPRNLAPLLDEAGVHRAELGLGAVLAVKAREFSGHMPEYTVAAADVLGGGLTVAQAVSIADETSSAGDADGPVPSYELWRRRIRANFAPAARGVE
jgi:enediyne biosynthesis protein E2